LHWTALKAARKFHAQYEKALRAEHGPRKVDALREVLERVVAEHEEKAPLALRPL
jgi:hypothetical protein